MNNVLTESAIILDGFMSKLQESYSDSALELKNFIDNDGDLHKSTYLPMVKNFMKKKSVKKYSPDKARKMFIKLSKLGARGYVKSYGGNFSRQSVDKTASLLFNDFEKNSNSGAFDEYLIKRKR